MAILIYAEQTNGKINKTAKELASYAAELSRKTGMPAYAVSFGAEDPETLFQYGISKVLNITNDAFKTFSARAYSEAIAQAAEETGARILLVGESADAKYLTPFIAAQWQAAYVTGVISEPLTTEPFVVKRKAFSNKAIAHVQLNGNKKILGIAKNSYGLKENPSDGTVKSFEPQVDSTLFDEFKVLSVEKATGKVSLSDAEIIVSGGRGLKGPENWGMIEELAEILGAATACSKPVADMGWRSHTEHVGQTGKQVAPNLYIAIGISGAIQHLAGVNSSKNILVINIDPEAPFFKAADYGVVGDAFEVVPRLIEKLKAFKAEH